MSLELWISMTAEKLIQDEHPVERHRFTGRTESLVLEFGLQHVHRSP